MPNNNNKIYLDYMASTPIDVRVLNVMNDVLSNQNHLYGNPSSTHDYGHMALDLIDQAKQQIAQTIHAEAKEIIFTSGATEANNLALFGVAKQYNNSGNHIITMTSEHKAVLDPCKYLEREGFKVTYLKPNSSGLVDLDALSNAITEQTILVSIMWVNNETGMINPMQDIAKIVKNKGVLLHCDAAQAVGKVSIDLQQIPIDLLSLAAHKVYGPKGVGALYIRSKPKVRLQPLLFGGGQQFKLRPGTLPTHQIVGMGEAFALAKQQFDADQAHKRYLRDKLWQGIKDLDVVLHGDFEHRVAGNLNVAFKGVNGESLLFALRDLMVSTGSACNAASVTPSHVLTAIGVAHDLAQASIRFSIGRMTTETEIEQAIALIRHKVGQLKMLSPKQGED